MQEWARLANVLPTLDQTFTTLHAVARGLLARLAPSRRAQKEARGAGGESWRLACARGRC